MSRADGVGTIVVAGASSGIGEEIASRLADSGVPVVGLSRRGTVVHPKVKGVALDLTDDDAVDAQLPSIIEAAAPIRGIVHSVGDIYDQASVTDISWSRWVQTLDVCLGTAVRLVRHSFRAIAENAGTAVFVSSVASTRPYPGIADYCAAKAALESFVRSLAGELASYGATANAVCPAVVDTPLFHRSPYSEQEAAGWHRLGRVGRPRDVADVVMFLVSPAASWMTGTSVTLDGGMLL